MERETRGATEVTLHGGRPDFTPRLEFVQPDDGVIGDHTMFQVRLPQPVAPDAEVQFKIAFRVKLPETLARTGYKRDFVMGAQWFPKVGVWWRGAWNCHQFHRSAEFFSDFGTYVVKLTVRRELVLGATGEQVASVDNPDGTRTVTSGPRTNTTSRGPPIATSSSRTTCGAGAAGPSASAC